jgi:hypothetical protein
MIRASLVGRADDFDGLQVVDAETLPQMGNERAVDTVVRLALMPLGYRVYHFRGWGECDRHQSHPASRATMKATAATVGMKADIYAASMSRSAMRWAIQSSTSARTKQMRFSPSSTGFGKRPFERQLLIDVRDKLVSLQASLMLMRVGCSSILAVPFG